MTKRKGPKSATNPVSLAALRRRLFVVKMKEGGANYREISQAAIEEFGISNLPNGWDERYAYKDLVRYFERMSNEMAEDREHLRQLELARLDVMLMGIWDDAADGQRDSIGTVLNIMTRRARMTGIDAPIEFTLDDIRTITRRFHQIVTAEVEDENIRERIFDALGSASAS